MFGTASDDFEDEEVHDPDYKPPQTITAPQAYPTVAQPTQPNNYPFAAPAQISWQQPTAAAAPASYTQQPTAQPLAHAASNQPQTFSAPGSRIPAAWGGAAPTLAPATAALPTATPPHQQQRATTPPTKPTPATAHSPFIPVAAAYTPNSATTTTAALPTVHVSHPVRDTHVALPTPVTSAINVSTYKGPSAFSNGESYFDDED